MSHRQREALASRFPVHVTMKIGKGLPRLRRKRERKVLLAAFAAGSDRMGFRLCHYAILNDHLQFLFEAKDRQALSRGLQGLIRIAKALNKLWGRRGRVFSHRHHDRILKTPREGRNAIRYVLANGKKHEGDGRQVRIGAAADVFTSAPWFDGFRETIRFRGLEATIRPVADSKTWMLSVGWRRHGLLSVYEMPASA